MLQQQGSDLFKKNVSDIHWVAFDTETTGIHPATDFLVELAALSFDEEFEHRRFQSLVKPPISIPPVVQAIHGLGDDHVKGAPPAFEVLSQFKDYLSYLHQPVVLLAHNAPFDLGMIEGELKRSRLTRSDQSSDGAVLELGNQNFSSDYVVIDHCSLSRGLLPDLKSHKLSSLSDHFSVSHQDAHRAMGDVLALKQVFLKLLGLAADLQPQGRPLLFEDLLRWTGGTYSLSFQRPSVQMVLSPIMALLDECCQKKIPVKLIYQHEEDVRYITPHRLRQKAFRIYLDAFCHRDQIEKSFRTDRILRFSKVDTVGSEFG